MAGDAGMEALTSPRDLGRVRAAIKAAGYDGRKVVLIAATDFPVLKAMSDVGADMMQRAGLNVDYQALDWGGVLARRAKKDPPDKGGWNVFFTGWAGTDHLNPAGHLILRCNGPDAWFGWPTSAAIEQLRNQWFDAPDVPAQARICADIQRETLQEVVPYVPLGQYLQPTAYRTNLQGVLNGFALFWNVQKT